MMAVLINIFFDGSWIHFSIDKTHEIHVAASVQLRFVDYITGGDEFQGPQGSSSALTSVMRSKSGNNYIALFWI